MFGVPELDNLLCNHLRLHDLAQCARVSKKWNKVVIPYLWYKIDVDNVVTPPRWSKPDVKIEERYKGLDPFCQLVVNDYVQEQQQHHKLQHERLITEQVQDHLVPPPSPPSPPPPPATSLAKYAPWIRLLSHPRDVSARLHGMIEEQQLLNEQGEKLSAHELLVHLFNRCPLIRVPDMYVCQHKQKLDTCKMLELFLLPYVCRLRLEYGQDRTPVGCLELLEFLDRHQRALEYLHLKFRITHDEDENGTMGDREEIVAKEWTSLKELVLDHCYSDPTAFWSRLFRRCSQVERLSIIDHFATTPSVADGIAAHMHNLREITLSNLFRGIWLTDDMIALILSSSRKGWKVVRLQNMGGFKSASMEALLKHSSTLERLVIEGCDGPTSHDLIQVLTRCSRLQSFVDTDEESYSDCHFPRIHATLFIDRGPINGSLKPWACEDSLKELKIRITGIPRPDLKEKCIFEEKYPGQGRDIQSQVYDRLARLVNLETLWLGDQRWEDGNHDHDDMEDQFDSLEMSLESGLHRLSGLEKLEELSLVGMAFNVGIKEVQWMIEQWPRLRVVYEDVRVNSFMLDVRAWLENHPRIELRRLCVHCHRHIPSPNLEIGCWCRWSSSLGPVRSPFRRICFCELNRPPTSK
ncbi:MAG: hypothetical protein J3Q66DRAFT_350406 [Benniella sp.]|nr:MAG: hypothetical protein J3Q66DRAFT_350406 [Benniella sp.]